MFYAHFYLLVSAIHLSSEPPSRARKVGLNGNSLRRDSKTRHVLSILETDQAGPPAPHPEPKIVLLQSLDQAVDALETERPHATNVEAFRQTVPVIRHLEIDTSVEASFIL